MTHDEIIDELLGRADALGWPRERLVIGACDEYVKGIETGYQTFVGATEDRENAHMLDFVVKDIASESHQQVMALIDRNDDKTDKTCPRCGSKRFGLVQAGEKTTLRLFTFDECMDCGKTVGEKPRKYRTRFWRNQRDES